MGTQEHQESKEIQDVPMYEEVTDPISLVTTIDTQDNVAYGCTQQL